MVSSKVRNNYVCADDSYHYTHYSRLKFKFELSADLLAPASVLNAIEGETILIRDAISFAIVITANAFKYIDELNYFIESLVIQLNYREANSILVRLRVFRLLFYF